MEAAIRARSYPTFYERSSRLSNNPDIKTDDAPDCDRYFQYESPMYIESATWTVYL